jgi:hypothetical protein
VGVAGDGDATGVVGGDVGVGLGRSALGRLPAPAQVLGLSPATRDATCPDGVMPTG